MIDKYGIYRPNKTGNRWTLCIDYREEVPHGTYRPFYGQVALGNATQWNIFACWYYRSTGKWLFVGVEGRGCYSFNSFVHGDYIMEKMNIFGTDTVNLADWINAQLHFGEFKEQGQYDEQFMKAEY